MAKVFAAMSGGVDSSVAAALLLEAGHEVVGVTMQLLPSSAAEGGCCGTTAVRDAHRVCDLLGILHYTLNFREDFRRDVLEPVCDAYASGRTPNPCILCNDRLKFAELWRRAELMGADLLATGHYARVVRDEDGAPWLAGGTDRRKDQSYFLYRMTREQLERSLFPVGALTKPEVRAIAAELGLPTAQAPESQDVCFTGDVSAFVASERPKAATPGPIVDLAGGRLGTHLGLAHYTVGQRKGLGLPGEAPLYVVQLDAANNAVIVGPRESLEVSDVTCVDVMWRGTGEERVDVRVRYRQEPIPATARAAADGRLEISLDVPVAGVAPGQAAVCYRGSVVVGGGVVEEAA
jgi:tRNA-uridine 2-sulfurtransferase